MPTRVKKLKTSNKNRLFSLPSTLAVIGLAVIGSILLLQGEAAPTSPIVGTPAYERFAIYPSNNHLPVQKHLNRRIPYSFSFMGRSSKSAFIASYEKTYQPGWTAGKEGLKPSSQRRREIVSTPLAFGKVPSVTDSLNTPTGSLTDEQACAVAKALKVTKNGGNDAAFSGFGKQLVKIGHPDATIRLGWEYNGNWYIWSTIGKCSTESKTNAQLFAAAYRQVVNTMRKVNGQAFTFDWNGAGERWGKYYVATDAYPGDNYVDVIGTDMYGRYNRAKDLDTWNRVAKPSLNDYWNFAKSRKKLFSVPEYGIWGINPEKRRPESPSCSSPDCGDLPNFIEYMVDYLNNVVGESLAYHGYFNTVTNGYAARTNPSITGTDHRLWEIETFDPSSADYQKIKRKVFVKTAQKVEELFSGTGIVDVTDYLAPSLYNTDISPPSTTTEPDPEDEPTTDNLLKNPNFDYNLSEWTAKPTSNVTTTNDTNPSVNLAARSSGYVVVRQIVAITSGQAYRFSASLNLNNVSTPALGAYLGYEFRDANNNILVNKNAGIHTGTKTVTSTAEAVAPTNAVTAHIKLVIAPGSGSVKFDDTSVTKVLDSVVTDDPTPTLQKPGDISKSNGTKGGDGMINVNDLNYLISKWGQIGASTDGADINSDGVVDIKDIVELLGLWE